MPTILPPATDENGGQSSSRSTTLPGPTKTLPPSRRVAVISSVTAALFRRTV
jgi:hypothetical protein